MGGRPPPNPKKLIREFKRKVREPVVLNKLIFFELAQNGKSLHVFDMETFKGKFIILNNKRYDTESNVMVINETKINVNLIGIAGVAGSGKDTFAKLIGNVFSENGTEVNYLSFAKKLKSETAAISKKLYNIDPTNCSRDEKNLIRPLLLAHGAIMREKTEGKYWIDGIKDLLDENKINIITDVRFCEYACDEVNWIQSNGGIIVHISRFFEENGQRIYILPDNEYEKRNDKNLNNKSNYSFSWPTDVSKQKKYSNKFLKWFVKNYIEK